MWGANLTGIYAETNISKVTAADGKRVGHNRQVKCAPCDQAHVEIVIAAALEHHNLGHAVDTIVVVTNPILEGHFERISRAALTIGHLRQAEP